MLLHGKYYLVILSHHKMKEDIQLLIEQRTIFGFLKIEYKVLH